MEPRKISAIFISATHTNQTNESYGYDGVGNRTSSHLSATYSHQPFNRLVSTASATYTYDTNGNLISKTDASGTTQYASDFENRLKQVTLPNGNVVSYKYDALGRRIELSASVALPLPLTTTRFIYDGADVIRDTDGNGITTTDYVNALGIDEKLRQTTGAVSLYFVQDHVGSTRALTDVNGDVVEQLTYDSFGNSGGSTRTRYTYTGRERDPDTSLMYYRARWYDPQLGRFMNEDPIGFNGGDVNLDVYVVNNPTNFRDPTGKQRADRDRPGDIEWARGLRKAIDRMPQPASSGCAGAAWGPLGALGDFWSNYEDMRRANTIGADKFFHCMANCEAAKRGRSGRLAASGISELRELIDENIKGDPRSACDADRFANNIGRGGASSCKPCTDVCARFKPNGMVYPVPRPTPKPVD